MKDNIAKKTEELKQVTSDTTCVNSHFNHNSSRLRCIYNRNYTIQIDLTNNKSIDRRRDSQECVSLHALKVGFSERENEPIDN